MALLYKPLVIASFWFVVILHMDGVLDNVRWDGWVEECYYAKHMTSYFRSTTHPATTKQAGITFWLLDAFVHTLDRYSAYL